MSAERRAASLLLAAFVLAAAAASARASAAGAGQIFETGSSGRALGMGNAYTAAVNDATSLYYNPAGLGLLEAKEVHLMRASLFGGASYDYLSYAHNLKKKPGGWSVQIIRLGVSGPQGRDENNLTTGGFTYAETAMGIGYGVRGAFVPDLSMGMGVKMLSRTLGPSADKHMALDMGAQYGPVLDGALTFGAVVQNIASKSSGDTSDTLSPKIKLGAAYRVLGPMLVALDMTSAKEFNLGAEYRFGMMALRAGFAPEGLTFGGGITVKKAFSFDLALVNNASLGLTQRISLGYRFGANKPKKLSALAEEYLNNGLSELEQRNYATASRNIQSALGIDPAIGGKEWKRKAARLRTLLEGMDLEEAKDQGTLQEQTPQSQLAHRAVMSYLVGENVDAMLMAHVAAGGTGGDSVYMRILQSMSKATRQSIVREDVVALPLFIQDRTRKTVEAIHTRRFDAAIRTAREALLIQPDDGGSWMRLGSAYFASGNKTKALESYRKALNLEPDNVKLREFISENFHE